MRRAGVTHRDHWQTQDGPGNLQDRFRHLQAPGFTYRQPPLSPESNVPPTTRKGRRQSRALPATRHMDCPYLFQIASRPSSLNSRYRR